MNSTIPLAASAQTVMKRCDILAHFSEEPGCLTRRFASQALKQANEAVATWMRAAGMSVRSDEIGNLLGRYEADHAEAKTFLLGSHLDSVRDAGKYDGPLGVMVALACIERLRDRHQRLPFAIELVAFTGEEGLRYHRAYLGSKAAAGTFDPDALLLTDADGISMADAIRAFGGDPEPEGLQRANWRAADLSGYCEVHIEQGPVLESRNLPLAVVSAIAGQSRVLVTFTGEAGHAGTVPMSLRHDALSAAAEFILAVETYARDLPGLVATVGQVTVLPGASNVIPGHVSLTLDVRHQNDTLRKQACDAFQQQAMQLSERRHITYSWQDVQESRTVACSPHLVSVLQRALAAVGYPSALFPSGAGHDGVALSDLTDIAMLFVRCRGGISHHPDEAVSVEDVASAIQVLEQFLQLLA